MPLIDLKVNNCEIEADTMIHPERGNRTGVDMLYHFVGIRQTANLRTNCHVILGLFFWNILLVGGLHSRQSVAEELGKPEPRAVEDA